MSYRAVDKILKRIVCISLVVSANSLWLSAPATADVDLGSRPLELIESMDEGALKTKLQSCASQDFSSTKFSIGHRGAPLQFPEHTKESYVAAANMGAGIVECDVTFTKDRELVCRHSQCDLHTTTNILEIPELAAKCSIPFTPAKRHNRSGKVIEPATAQCCTSDITLEEFLSLKGKKDSADRNAATVEEYVKGAAGSNDERVIERGTLMTHAQSIELFKALGVSMTPELKSADVKMPYQGDYTQKEYAQQMVDEYIAANVPASDVHMQSFNLDDVKYWLKEAPEFGEQAVYLDGRYSKFRFNPDKQRSWKPSMNKLKAMGVNTIAPPLWVLLDASSSGEIVPSTYALKAKEAGLDIVTWTLERSGSLTSGGGWYYQSVSDVIDGDGDVYNALDVLAKDVGVKGVFSDWPATVTYYGNCMGLSLGR